MSTAHASMTPHLVGQLAKARREIAARLEQWGSPAADDRAGQLLDVLQDLGWTPKRDLAEAAPLRPDQPADDNSPGRREFRAARAALAERRNA